MNILTRLEEEINLKFKENLTKEIKFNGECIRFGKKDHIWVYGHEWEYKGNLYQQIMYGSWKYDPNPTVLKSWNVEVEKDKNFKKAYKNKTLEVRSKIDLDVQRKNKECREKWSVIWNKCTKAINHDYLDYKGIKAHGLKIDQNGVLIIPCKDQNGLTGVQRIYKDPENGEFVKKFSAGIKIKGSIHALKKLKDEKFCYLSEGYATAATIQEACPEIPSVCCFNAINISRAINTIRMVYPNIKIIIAADNDHATKGNPGLKYAYNAAKTNKDVIVKYPKFETVNSSWTDFNDLHQFESLDKVQEQLKFTLEEFAVLECLGHHEEVYYYSSSENQQIISLSFSAHNKQGLRRIFANRSFWLKTYGFEKDEDIKIDWDRASEDLMFKCHEKGIFDPKRVRGIGVWQDGDKYCINDGQRVINKNENSIFSYQKSNPIDYSFRENEGLDLIYLLNAFKQLEYKNPNDYFYLSAWYIQAQIFSVLPWRFHIWLTGSAGAGKSTILKWLHGLSMNNVLTNNTTAAGIRQKVRSDACSVIYDEAEATEERTKGVISLAREMSSNGEFEALRGTVSGNALHFNTQCVFCFGSVQIDLAKDTDRSRFFLIEMNETKDQDPRKYSEICLTFDEFTKNKNAIFTYIYKAIPNIKYNYNFCKASLKKDFKLESRLADQIGMALACYYVYYSNGKITEEHYREIVSSHNLNKSEYTEQNTEKEHDTCYNTLMGVVIDNYSNMTVGEAIFKIKNNYFDPSEVEKVMGIYGLKYFKEDDSLFVSNKNDNLAKKMKSYSDITRILKRDKSIIISEKGRTRMNKYGQVRGIKIRVKEIT